MKRNNFNRLKSSGKSYFLNSLLGINCLVSNDNISTNFVYIISI